MSTKRLVESIGRTANTLGARDRQTSERSTLQPPDRPSDASGHAKQAGMNTEGRNVTSSNSVTAFLFFFPP